ncbi:helix-turn-helix domain-containing protein [Massilia sp. RP-1-19]|uniref:Helix-turn-helix domain-containing protein n=1 Tax=Massilia polaris TaxID=2728846 RepID=A0A848HR79_9BURK|nr:YdaS family helix-turn-helix protein [Massilia polaris]NML62251.1 helix-turn-helix domain-containing protein [Massilia polaris]
MTLREYLDSLERGATARFAEQLGVSPSYLSQMAAGTAPISPKRCVRIEILSGGHVTRKNDLHPFDWQEIWPELAIPPCGRTNNS